MYDNILKGLRAALYYFSIAAMSLMLIVIFAQVITRYCFNYTPEWSEELARFLFVWVVFLGSALIMGESGHLAVEFFPKLMRGTVGGKILAILINLAGYVFIGILFFNGAEMTRVMTFQVSPGLSLPMSYIYSVIPLSSVLMLLYLVKHSLEIVRASSEHEDLPTK
ncbi:C4-dicarboxylate ABC transporter substrate-binding protein [candidate division KSB3 bacterium]|uniref:C4-dicarboxylate ABC transporter substrate-binding protein n=1 Tax=candidate division KSB3 bacterium TaxID=2044937 RepID=A0A2G6E1R8_9BACT|nr:MAG: C4-dicarboxylate ABC transporter substrate-binding protein [candidate division KSB3 bacterium]PIE28642.1 MAG: C4-dicarboxylate ABC transporter substrate-binding protein [candidate division KSB3 bacterium]